jgi:putative tricarboxylic transport membrane protein
MSFKKKMTTLVAGTIVTAMLFTGCSTGKTTVSSGDNGPTTPEVKYPEKALEFIAPAGAGGGWDTTIRTVAKTLQDTKLVSVPMPVTNKPGGGGGIALAYLEEKKGSDSIVTVYSPPLLLINLNGSTPLGYKNTTPLARLIADYACFVVAKDSPYKSITDVMEALKKDPKSVKVGGTSAAGSMDHLQFLKIAKAAGVANVKEISYISFQDGSGPAQVLGGHVDILSTGIADAKALMESGDLRALAITADKRIGEGMIAEIPTCKEQGIDATFINWRGIFGAPDMPEYAVKYWQDTLKKMSETEEWKAACKTNGWDNIYLGGEDFVKFIEQENENSKALLEEIGMLKK